MIRSIFLFAIAGAVGTLLRVGMVLVMREMFPDGPWGTWLVNILGCFLFGCVVAWSGDHLSMQTRVILLSGFFGAFTTFSAYVFECSEYLLAGRYAFAAANVLGQNILGLMAMFSGMALVR